MSILKSAIRACYHHRRLQLAVGLFLSLLLGGLASLWRGPDLGFDNMNYHIYNAWAFLNNRLNVDLYAAEFRTYFSPLIELPYYFLALKWFPGSPRTVAFIMGLPAGILFFTTFLLIFETLAIFRGIKRSLRYFYTFLFSFFGLTGISITSQIGYTSNEIPIACLIIGGLLAFIYFRNKIILSALIAGLLIGAATGLKLTAHVFVIPFIAGLLLYHTSWKDRIQSILAFCVAWWVAFLALFGWWGWTLYQLTGNPVFPGMNNLFHSDWIPVNSGMDNRFIPHKLRHILFFPFYWVERAMVTDGISTDIRFLYAYSIAGIAAIFCAIRVACRFLSKDILKRSTSISPATVAQTILSVPGETQAGLPVLPSTGVPPVGLMAGATMPRPPFPLPRDEASRISFFYFVFIVLSYVIWEYQFSTLRYAVPIEALLGLFVFICVFSFFRLQDHPKKHILITSILTFSTISALITDKDERGRVAFASGPVLEMQVPQLQDKALVIAFPMSLAMAPAIVEKSPNTIFVSGLFEVPTNGPAKTWNKLSVLQDGKIKTLVREKIANHDGPIYVLAHKVFDFTDPKISEKCEQHNIKVIIENAETITTNFGIYKLYRTECIKPKTVRLR